MVETILQPIAELHAHILDQIEQKGYFRSKPSQFRSLEEVQQGNTDVVASRQDLHLSVSYLIFSDLFRIDFLA